MLTEYILGAFKDLCRQRWVLEIYWALDLPQSRQQKPAAALVRARCVRSLHASQSPQYVFAEIELTKVCGRITASITGSSVHRRLSPYPVGINFIPEALSAA
jgi:hypothetical protein